MRINNWQNPFRKEKEAISNEEKRFLEEKITLILDGGGLGSRELNIEALENVIKDFENAPGAEDIVAIAKEALEYL